MHSVDFTTYKHPVLAVRCPTCKAGEGAWCKRPSEHSAGDFHVGRKSLADDVFIAQHGLTASIENTSSGWVIDTKGRAKAAEQVELFETE